MCLVRCGCCGFWLVLVWVSFWVGWVGVGFVRCCCWLFVVLDCVSGWFICCCWCLCLGLVCVFWFYYVSLVFGF